MYSAAQNSSIQFNTRETRTLTISNRNLSPALFGFKAKSLTEMVLYFWNSFISLKSRQHDRKSFPWLNTLISKKWLKSSSRHIHTIESPSMVSTSIFLFTEVRFHSRSPSLPPANVVCEGYVFTPVCDSVNRGAYVVAPEGVHGCSGGACMVTLGGHAWLLWGTCVVAPGGACMVALGGGGAWLLWGVCVVAPGVCMVAPGGHVWLLGGMHGCSRGSAWLLLGGHAWLLPGGACMGYNEIQRYGQWVGSMHPTGMHSC